MYSDTLRPLANAKSLAVCRDVFVRAFVPGVFRSRYPANIVREITFIVANAIKFMPIGRRLADILQKVGKVFPPPVANRYASAAVILVGVGVGIGASIDHPPPSPVGPSIVHAMLGRSFSAFFAVQASTGERASDQIVLKNRLYGSAITPNQDARSAAALAGKRKPFGFHDQPANPLANVSSHLKWKLPNAGGDHLPNSQRRLRSYLS
jgi:hypothetical protein